MKKNNVLVPHLYFPILCQVGIIILAILEPGNTLPILVLSIGSIITICFIAILIAARNRRGWRDENIR